MFKKERGSVNWHMMEIMSMIYFKVKPIMVGGAIVKCQNTFFIGLLQQARPSSSRACGSLQFAKRMCATHSTILNQ